MISDEHEHVNCTNNMWIWWGHFQEWDGSWPLQNICQFQRVPSWLRKKLWTIPIQVNNPKCHAPKKNLCIALLGESGKATIRKGYDLIQRVLSVGNSRESPLRSYLLSLLSLLGFESIFYLRQVGNLPASPAEMKQVQISKGMMIIPNANKQTSKIIFQFSLSDSSAKGAGNSNLCLACLPGCLEIAQSSKISSWKWRTRNSQTAGPMQSEVQQNAHLWGKQKVIQMQVLNNSKMTQWHPMHMYIVSRSR